MERKQPTLPAQFENLRGIRDSLSQESPRKSSKIWIIIGTVAVVILLIGAAVQVATPKTVKVPETNFVRTNTNGTSSNLRKVTYTGSAIDLPNAFSIFSATAVLSEGEVIQDLSAKYGLLRTDPEAPYWLNGDLSLLHDPTTQTYTLTLKDFANESKLPIVNTEKALEVATAYLKETFPTISLRPMIDQANYFQVALEAEADAPKEKANAINIPFTSLLDSNNYPVVFEKATSPLFVVTVDGNETIRVVTFYPQFQQYTKIDAKTPLSVDQALAQIQNGVASIITASIVDFNRVNMSDLTSATFTNATIEYRVDPESSLLYPFYRFSGTATSANNITADVVVITPAVKTTVQSR